MSSISIPIWKKTPFLRLVLPLILGIILQWYFRFGTALIIVAGISFVTGLCLFRLLPLTLRFKLPAIQGLLINLVVVVAGVALTYQKDIRNHEDWFGNYYHNNDYVVVTVNETPVEKNNSYKAEAFVENIVSGDTSHLVSGKVIVYFIKDSTVTPLRYGDKIIFNKKLQAIKGSGNPGAFDYGKYAAFRQIFHSVFLRKGEWVMLPGKHRDAFEEFLISSRQNILNVLHTNMQGDDDQLSIAEALLIGYTQDLDKDLVQAYSNTGVVHIIAISGMHLGLIYLILIWIFNRIPYIKKWKIVRAVLILTCLWLFALLTGGGASILRSAVMFTCIVIGNNFSRQASIYNSLSASAFILLCVNPYYLWDVGFQLSYLALSGIVIFQKPVYHLLFIKNKPLNKVWELTAVSLAAQLLTFPVCLYYFHQFPTIFLLTNLLTVPLSTLILIVEIFLVSLAWIHHISIWIGKMTWWLIWLMNKIILFCNDLPYALWQGIPATVISSLLLYLFICSTGSWLLNKSKTAFKLSLFSLLFFTSLHAYSKWGIARQQKIIVYNVSQHQAIDLVSGSHYLFVGDTLLADGGILHNYNIKPGRIAFQLNRNSIDSGTVYQSSGFFTFADKRILILDSSIAFKPGDQKIDLDFIIISKNPAINLSQMAQVFTCSSYIFDASNSLWKIEQWKRDCVKLHLPFYSVPDKGAFITDL